MAGEGPSVREAIQGALSSAASTASPAPSPSSETSAPASSPAPVSETAPKSTLNGPSIPTDGNDAGSPVKGPNRSADGKFQAKAPTDAPLAPSADAQPKSPDLTEKPKDDGSPPILAPNGWGKDVKADWSTLPRAVQTEIEKREKDRDRALHQAQSKFQTQLRNFDAVNRVLQPRAQQFALNGGPAAYLDRLLTLNDAADQNPTAFVHWFAKQKGLDLNSLVAGTQSQAPVDPTVQALQNELASTKRALLEIGNHVRGSSQARENEAQGTMLQTIEKWSQEKDEGGNFKRPYFERLEEDVLTLLPRVKAMNPGASPTEWLDAAYESAVYANSETRSAVQKMADQKRFADEAKAKAKAAEQARITGTSIAGSTAPNAGSVPAKSIREGLQRALEAQRGRAA